MFIHIRSSAPKIFAKVWMENSNILSQKDGKSGCQTRVRQTIGTEFEAIVSLVAVNILPFALGV